MHGPSVASAEGDWPNCRTSRTNRPITNFSQQFLQPTSGGLACGAITRPAHSAGIISAQKKQRNLQAQPHCQSAHHYHHRPAAAGSFKRRVVQHGSRIVVPQGLMHTTANFCCPRVSFVNCTKNCTIKIFIAIAYGSVAPTSNSAASVCDFTRTTAALSKSITHFLKILASEKLSHLFFHA